MRNLHSNELINAINKKIGIEFVAEDGFWKPKHEIKKEVRILEEKQHELLICLNHVAIELLNPAFEMRTIAYKKAMKLLKELEQ